ncbi:hypothetical protein GTP56_04015 [Duganella sp. FT134W]|uniref:Uncharacterized protein n=1 Tax=Duganella margarita TaxID=2692170 RepID=A0A7X4GY46_9BURK|nr:hypothetical protein [Duganella margarita]MYM71360.1 hypothetical protein [Duganella margarita]
MNRLAAALTVLAAPALAAEPLAIHYNERPPYHYTMGGMAQGEGIDKLLVALRAANIPYQLRSTPAKQQLILLKANLQPACMLAWVGLPGRERAGKLSEIVYDDRRLWCTQATPDDVMQRLNKALRK